MDRKAFLKMGCCGLIALASSTSVESSTSNPSDAASRNDADLKFIQNWLTDLMEAIDTEVDMPTKIRLMSSCGRGCYRRFQFKQDIAAKGKGSVENLIAAYAANFEV